MVTTALLLTLGVLGGGAAGQTRTVSVQQPKAAHLYVAIGVAVPVGARDDSHGSVVLFGRGSADASWRTGTPALAPNDGSDIRPSSLTQPSPHNS